MKRNIFLIFKWFNFYIVGAVMLLTACSDYFNPTTDDELDGSKGFTSNTEMYTGFLGIITKMQAVGDKEILLTEPRGELIEPSEIGRAHV